MWVWLWGLGRLLRQRVVYRCGAQNWMLPWILGLHLDLAEVAPGTWQETVSRHLPLVESIPSARLEPGLFRCKRGTAWSYAVRTLWSLPIGSCEDRRGPVANLCWFLMVISFLIKKNSHTIYLTITSCRYSVNLYNLELVIFIYSFNFALPL